ncbi:hypothetical protein NPIL_677891 [Nephila pilipes]|uniref:Uncharacterized protein n=1 Tax=Nephila pilipes TaxID=299642 RepID=A0A8X6PKM4_NEPPI|nr:hypothetical protein NPIL_677891 [Nephila pilipes]
MFCDKTESKLKFNLGLKSNINRGTSNSHNIDRPIDVPLSINLKNLNTIMKNDCSLYTAESQLSTEATDFVSNSIGSQSHNKPNKQRYIDIDYLECVQNDKDLPFEKRRRLCKKNYNRNLKMVPQVGWKKRIRRLFRDFARRVRTYFSS